MQTKWYGVIEKFNQSYPLRTYAPGCRTLEIGAGIGSHLKYEDFSQQEYYCVELRQELCDKIKSRYPQVNALSADCQENLPFEDGYFSRVLAIQVLEHLPDLPKALRQVWRVLSDDGQFAAVIPCEGGMANNLARSISARPAFEKKYRMSYDWLINSEHINMCHEILEELDRLFIIRHRRFYPLLAPIVTINLAIGLTLTKKKSSIVDL
jgi:SAM-dependent methyltransferase